MFYRRDRAILEGWCPHQGPASLSLQEESSALSTELQGNELVGDSHGAPFLALFPGLSRHNSSLLSFIKIASRREWQERGVVDVGQLHVIKGGSRHSRRKGRELIPVGWCCVEHWDSGLHTGDSELGSCPPDP